VEHLVAIGETAQEPCSLIARSIQSPVFRAVQSLYASGQLKARLNIIIASLDGTDEAGLATATAFVSGVRMARNPRLLDAHEQLVLGSQASWIGDCMRREPEKRDAWECYAPACPETTRRASISFDRLWKVCDALPAREITPADLAEFVPAGEAAGEALVLGPTPN
jgi:hypothetical protein